MKVFDVKKFRGEKGLNQEEFAQKIKRSQATVSRIEMGVKTVSDKFLDAIAKAFDTDLEQYKSYNQDNKEGQPTAITTAVPGGNHLSPKHEITDLEMRYYRLLEEKAKIADRYFDLSEKYALLESENNALLKKIIFNTEQLLERVEVLEKR